MVSVVAGEARVSIAEVMQMRLKMVFAFHHVYMSKQGVRCRKAGGDSADSLEQILFMK
jgi:hypothetical protein